MYHPELHPPAHDSAFLTPAAVFLYLVYFTRRHLRNHRFLRGANGARLSRLQRAKVAGQRAVQCDLADFEARSREAYRTGTRVVCSDSRSSFKKMCISNRLHIAKMSQTGQRLGRELRSCPENPSESAA